MEIRLHALHGMHFIMYHYDHPINSKTSQFIFVRPQEHENDSPAFTKMSTDREERFWKNAFTDAPSPALKKKKRGEKLSLPDLFWGEGCVCIGDRCFHWIHVEGRSNRRKNTPLQTKAYTWGRGQIYAPLLFALNDTNSHSSIVSFLPALSQIKLA